MKLYVLDCGQMITPDDNILAAFNTDQLKLVIPVPAYLIDHPKEGLVLIDTGFCYDHLPDEMKKGIAWSPSQRITTQIERLGYRPEKVNHVLLSHLHFDHAGQMTDFPHAVFHMRESEWKAAVPPSRGDYFPEDYEGAFSFRFEYVPEGEDYDLFGDGTVICLDTKGHSPGHQSFLVNLPNTGKLLLAVDAAHLPQYMETEEFFQDSSDVKGCLQAVEKLKKLGPECTDLIYGHDPATFSRMKKTPDYYD